MFQSLIARMAVALTAHRISYVITGGQAVLLYGEPRLTRDIDVILGASISRLPDLLKAIEDMALIPVPDNVRSFVEKTMILPVHHEETGVRVDFTFSLSPYTIETIARARWVAMSGQKVAFTSAEDLIIYKIFAGRPRDLEDVRSILLRNPGSDSAYIHRWLGEFDKSVEGGQFTDVFQTVLESTLK